MTLDALKSMALRDKAFYGDIGGITLSGGEPLSQWDSVRRLAEQLRSEGVHVAIDTAGYAPIDVVREVPLHADLVLVDLKLLSPALHRRWTGVDNASILDALRYWLKAMPERVWISIPLIPGVQDENEIKEIADFISGLPAVPPVRLIPFHRLGESKYKALGMPIPNFPGNPKRLMEIARYEFTRRGIQIIGF